MARAGRVGLPDLISDPIYLRFGRCPLQSDQEKKQKIVNNLDLAAN
jgi:hypothetical protein